MIIRYLDPWGMECLEGSWTGFHKVIIGFS